MTLPSAVQISGISHAYGQRIALRDLSLTINTGEIFALLGPNGSGKTTLFRVLSTLIPIQKGDVRIFGFDLRAEPGSIRRIMGVVFQAPSLDKKLTVSENIRHQAALYGLCGAELRPREREMLGQLGLDDRATEVTETLSGGLRRRVELAKGMIHHPQLLLLDEPSTGLDPGARSDLWTYLRRLRDESDATVVLTTHLLEEADKADRIAIVNEGYLVACDTPDKLKTTVGGDSIMIETVDPTSLSALIQQQFNVATTIVEGTVRLEQNDGHRWIARLVDAFPEQISSIRLGKPTLEDVFIDKTGHRFWRQREEELASTRRGDA